MIQLELFSKFLIIYDAHDQSQNQNSDICFEINHLESELVVIAQYYFSECRPLNTTLKTANYTIFTFRNPCMIAAVDVLHRFTILPTRLILVLTFSFIRTSFGLHYFYADKKYVCIVIKFT